MPDRALIRFIAEGVLLKKLGPAVLQYSFKLLSNLVSRVLSYSHLLSPPLTSSKEKEGVGGGGCPFCLNVKYGRFTF